MHLLGGAVMFAVPSVLPATVLDPQQAATTAVRAISTIPLLGGTALFGLPATLRAALPDPQAVVLAPGASAVAFLALVFIHSLCYMPTINLTNSVTFANLFNQEKEFPYIRVFGTLGWIAANLVVSICKIDTAAAQFQLAGGAAIALAVFSLTLPHTPPPAKGKAVNVREILGLDALSLFRHRSFAVFAICSFLICIPLAFYYGFAASTVKTAMQVTNPADKEPPVTAWMSVGQAAEVIFMVIMPFFFRKLGVKWMLALGMLSWVLRYGLFAVGITGPIFAVLILGVALHGLCYDFFFVTGFIYTDKRAAKEIRGQAQGLIVLLTYGVGLAIGGYVSGELYNNIVGKAAGADALPLLQRYWAYPAGLAAIVLVIFVALFRDDSHEPPIGAIARGEAQAATPATGA
jgi:nucleoside transporter